MEKAEASELRPELEDRAGLASVRLHFYPTAFMFHGIDVLRPSAVRLAYSLAKANRNIFERLKAYYENLFARMEFKPSAGQVQDMELKLFCGGKLGLREEAVRAVKA